MSATGFTSSMDSTVNVEAFDVGDTKVQHYGLLMKKPFGHKSARWQKRCVFTDPSLSCLSISVSIRMHKLLPCTSA